jgi:dipeptidyl aminopeptidase/acylaminoacyl peptidase
MFNSSKTIILAFIFKTTIMMKLILPFFLFTCLFSYAQKQDDSLWMPELYLKFRTPYQLVISPDGNQVAYTLRSAIVEGEKSEFHNEIWVSDITSKTSRQYTRNEKSSRSAAFSPDGKWLTFISERSGKPQIWMMPLNGGEPEQITDEKNGVMQYKWSPLGDKICFTKKDEKTEEEEKIEKEKRDVRVVDQNFKYAHLYSLQVKTDEDGKRKTQRLTAGEFDVVSFAWSPDGSQLVFEFAYEPTLNSMDLNTDIGIVDSDSSAVSNLVVRPGNDSSPTFSPDGKKIAFSSNGGTSELIGQMDVFILELNKKEPYKLAATFDRTANIVDWSSDGKYIYAQESRKTGGGIYKISTMRDDKSTPEFIGLNDGYCHNFALNTESGKKAFVYENSTTPPEIHISSVDNPGGKVLTNINSEIELPKMGKTEVIRWTSKDGLEIEGLLTYPIDYQNGKKYALVLQVHGGPAGVFHDDFGASYPLYMRQRFAERGFFVLRANPRGSSGYGKEFRYANVKDWGYGDFEDLMSGVDKTINDGLVDEDRLALMGWSYGGYMTSFAVTKTDRFKAASMGAGVSNMISMMTTDVNHYLAAHMAGEYWEDYDTYEKHSAIYHIGNVKTPTQVIHGENDVRVPFSQGQEFYIGLKRRGIDTEMIVLPRTPHGPREPNLLMEVSPRIISWFEKYIEL